MRRWFLLSFISVVALFLAGTALSPAFWSFMGLPPEVRLIQGQPCELSPKFPFDILISSPDTDVIRVMDTRNGSRGAGAVQGTAVKIEPLTLGEARLEVKAFGLFPLRRLNVRVLPEVRVMPGGQAIGVLTAASGVVVIGHYSIDMGLTRRECPASDAGILPGDIIIRADGEEISSTVQLEALIQQAGEAGRPIELVIKRGTENLRVSPKPLPIRSGGTILGGGARNGGTEEQRYGIGVYIRDTAVGVGTLSFWFPKTRRYAALGHPVVDAATARQLEVRDGRIVRAQIMGINQGLRGHPGEKIGAFESETQVIGTIEKNTRFGIFGKLLREPEGQLISEPVTVALADQVRRGEAELLTVIEDYRVERFKIEIVQVMKQKAPNSKGIVIKITDPRLLAATGGIIQGMSGSPILQDGKLVAVVTHVFLSDPSRGYATFAEWMVREAGFYDR